MSKEPQGISESKPELKNSVVVANDLILNARLPKLKINEQRLILYMLSKINMNDEDLKEYKIPLKELISIFGMKNKNIYNEFDKAAQGIMGKIIKWDDLSGKRKQKKRVTWCAYASLTEDNEYVELSFHPRLKPFLLNLKEKFTMCKFHAIFRLKNHYSLLIYQLLKCSYGCKKKTINIKVYELRDFIGATSKTYNSFGEFKRRVLEPIKKDINDKTDLEIDFLPDRDGTRKIQSVTFTMEINKNPVNLYPENQQLSLCASIDEDPPVDDEVQKKYESIKFDNISKLRIDHSDEFLLDLFADMEFQKRYKRKHGGELLNPAGWIKHKLPEPGKPNIRTKAYADHLAEKSKEEAMRAADENARIKRLKKDKENDEVIAYKIRIEAEIEALPEYKRQSLYDKAEIIVKADRKNRGIKGIIGYEKEIMFKVIELYENEYKQNKEVRK